MRVVVSVMSKGHPTPSQAPSTAGEEEEEEEEGGLPRRGPSPGNVRRMHAAERLNEVLGPVLLVRGGDSESPGP